MKTTTTMTAADGSQYDIPSDEMDAFKTDFPDAKPSNSYRVGSDEYVVRQDEDEAFRKDFADAEKTRTIRFANGKTRQFTANELSRFLRSKEFREGDEFKGDRAEPDQRSTALAAIKGAVSGAAEGYVGGLADAGGTAAGRAVGGLGSRLFKFMGLLAGSGDVPDFGQTSPFADVPREFKTKGQKARDAKENRLTKAGEEIERWTDILYPAGKQTDSAVANAVGKVNELGIGLAEFALTPTPILAGGHYADGWFAAYDAGKERGLSDEDAAKLGDARGAIDAGITTAFKNAPVHRIMKALGYNPAPAVAEYLAKNGTAVAANVAKSSVTAAIGKQMLVNAVASAGEMGVLGGVQAFADEAIMQEAKTGKIDWDRCMDVAKKSAVDQAAFGAVMGALPTTVRIAQARRQMDRALGQSLSTEAGRTAWRETNADGADKLARAVREEGHVSRRVAKDAGLPEMPQAERDALAREIVDLNDARARSNRVRPDEQQSAALKQEIARGGADAQQRARIFDEVLGEIRDAKELDDPARREELVRDAEKRILDEQKSERAVREQAEDDAATAAEEARWAESNRKSEERKKAAEEIKARRAEEEARRSEEQKADDEATAAEESRWADANRKADEAAKNAPQNAPKETASVASPEAADAPAAKEGRNPAKAETVPDGKGKMVEVPAGKSKAEPAQDGKVRVSDVIADGKKNLSSSPNARVYNTGKTTNSSILYTPTDGTTPFKITGKSFRHSQMSGNKADNAIVGRHVGEVLDKSVSLPEETDSATFRMSAVKIGGRDANVLFTIEKKTGRLERIDVLKTFNTKTNLEVASPNGENAEAAKGFEVWTRSIADFDRIWQEQFRPGIEQHNREKGRSGTFTRKETAMVPDGTGRTKPAPKAEAPSTPEVAGPEVVRREKPVKPARKTYSKSEYDADEGSGLLSWHEQDNGGRLYNIPVDRERTRPGGRVVLDRSDPAYERVVAHLGQSGVDSLHMDQRGNIYLKDRRLFGKRRGLVPKELQDMFGKEFREGSNDGLGRRFAEEARGVDGAEDNGVFDYEGFERRFDDEKTAYEKWAERGKAREAAAKEDARMKKKLPPAEYDAWRAEKDVEEYLADGGSEGDSLHSELVDIAAFKRRAASEDPELAKAVDARWSEDGNSVIMNDGTKYVHKRDNRGWVTVTDVDTGESWVIPPKTVVERTMEADYARRKEARAKGDGLVEGGRKADAALHGDTEPVRRNGPEGGGGKEVSARGEKVVAAADADQYATARQVLKEKFFQDEASLKRQMNALPPQAKRLREAYEAAIRFAQEKSSLSAQADGERTGRYRAEIDVKTQAQKLDLNDPANIPYMRWLRKNARVSTPGARRDFDRQQAKAAEAVVRNFVPDGKVVYHEGGAEVPDGARMAVVEASGMKENAGISNATAAIMRSRREGKALHSAKSVPNTEAGVNQTRNLYSKDGSVIGWFDKSTRTTHLLPGADATTVAHEIGWHASYDHAERLAAKGDRALLDKLNDFADNAPQHVKNDIAARYGNVGVVDPAVIREEVGAARYTMDNVRKITDEVQRRQAAKWYRKAWDSCVDAYKSMLTKAGYNKVNLDAMNAMTPEAAVDFMAKEMVSGKSLGKVEDRSKIDMGGKVVGVKQTLAAARDAYMRKMKDYRQPLKGLDEDLRKAGMDIGLFREARLQPGRQQKWADHVEAKTKEFFDLCKKDGVDYAEVNEYMWAQAAAERNAKTKSQTGAAMTDAEAADILARYQASPKAAALAKISDLLLDIQREGLEFRRDSGLLSDDLFNKWTAEEPHHVPMKSPIVDGEYVGRDGGGRVGRPEFKTAHGRTNLGDDPVGWIFAEALDAHLRGEENMLRRRLLPALIAHPEIGRLSAAADGSPRELRSRGGEGAANVLEFKHDGQSWIMELNGPRGEAIQAAMNGRNLVSAPKWMQTANRLWASTATQLSLTFSGRNAVADNIDVIGINYAENGFIKGTAANARHFKNMVRAYPKAFEFARTGKTSDPSLQAYIDAGGLIGGVGNEGYTSIAESIRKDFASGKKSPVALVKAVFRGIKVLNETVELATRVADFENQVAMKKSVKDAALHSREVSVDFNQKGEWTGVTNIYRMFSNSTLGAACRQVAAITASPKAAATVVSGMFGLGLAEGLLECVANGDESDAEKAGKSTGADVTEYTRANSIYFRKGEKVYRLPFHAGPFSVLKYAGNCAARKLMGAFDNKNTTATKAQTELANEALGVLMQFTGLGDAGPDVLQTVAPTLLQPVIQMLTNTDYAGRPIEKTAFNKNDPKAYNGRESTPARYKWLAEGLNDVSGGNKGRRGALDVSPEYLKYGLEQAGKNAMRDIENVVSVVGMMAGVEKADPRNMPGVRDYYRPQDGNDSRYFRAIDRYSADENDWKKNLASRTPEERRAYMAEHPWLRRTGGAKTRVAKLEDRIKDLRKLESGLRKNASGKWVERRTKPTDGEVEAWRAKRRALQAKVISIVGGE